MAHAAVSGTINGSITVLLSFIHCHFHLAIRKLKIPLIYKNSRASTVIESQDKQKARVLRIRTAPKQLWDGGANKDSHKSQPGPMLVMKKKPARSY